MNFYDVFTQFVDNSLFLGTIALDIGYCGVAVKVNDKLKSVSLFNEGVFRYTYCENENKVWKESFIAVKNLMHLKERIKHLKIIILIMDNSNLLKNIASFSLVVSQDFNLFIHFGKIY